MFKVRKGYIAFVLVLILILTLPISFFNPLKQTLMGGWLAIYTQSASIVEAIFPPSKYEEKRQLLEREVAKLKSELILAKNQARRKVNEAEVIYRQKTNWNESLWISKGEGSVKKLSPVLSGDVLIGLIDYVGKNQSRIRLITDPKLSPSVRAKREIGGRSFLLAKGELEGILDKEGRMGGTLFKGAGFNYDFPDSEGPARDLRTGYALESGSEIPIIKADDILVTTGLDGLFPKGLKVAKVTKVKPLKEGDFYYEIEAKSLMGNFNDLKWVTVIEPVFFDPQDLPVDFDR